jgi:hypothetical protein
VDENAIKDHWALLQKAKKALEKNRFNDVRILENAEEAKKEVLSLIPAGATVGAGGSQTLKETGITDALGKDRTIVRHSPAMGLPERREVWKKAAACDFYLASPQAVTLDGKMFFMDKYGNRLAAVIFGPSRVVLVAGYNKIVRDEREAESRTRNVAAVKNAVRLGTKVPCVKTGECEDCSSSERICNVYLGLLKKPPATEYTVILINEELGY